MSRKEDCQAGIKCLIDKSEENLRTILNYYGYDSYERKVKFLEDYLGVSPSTYANGVTYKDCFLMLCQYLKERDVKSSPLKELAKKVKTVDIPSGLSKDDIIEHIKAQLTEVEDNEKEPPKRKEVSQTASDIAEMIDDFSAEEQRRIFATIKKLHEKYERDPEEVAFNEVCERIGIEPCQEAWDIFQAGLHSRR